MGDDLLFNKALSKAMALCAGREMCFYDISQKLKSFDITDEKSEKILVLLKEGRFIDEKRFASAFAKDKFRHNKWGKLKIRSGLKMKRIPEELIREALDSIDETEYTDLLKTLIEKQKRTVRSKNKFDLKAKLLRFALSKGFESHLVYDLLNIGEEE